MQCDTQSRIHSNRISQHTKASISPGIAPVSSLVERFLWSWSPSHDLIGAQIIHEPWIWVTRLHDLIKDAFARRHSGSRGRLIDAMSVFTCCWYPLPCCEDKGRISQHMWWGWIRWRPVRKWGLDSSFRPSMPYPTTGIVMQCLLDGSNRVGAPLWVNVIGSGKIAHTPRISELMYHQRLVHGTWSKI